MKALKSKGKQYGGEGKEAAMYKKSDMKHPQHGGEGAEAVKSKKSNMGTSIPRNPGTAYRGPGASLKVSS
jgi:hypothetical protein